MVSPRPTNEERYFDILRRMTPEQRLAKAFELSDYARALFASGVRARNPGLSEPDLRRLVVEELKACRRNRRS